MDKHMASFIFVEFLFEHITFISHIMHLNQLPATSDSIIT